LNAKAQRGEGRDVAASHVRLCFFALLQATSTLLFSWHQAGAKAHAQHAQHEEMAVLAGGAACVDGVCGTAGSQHPIDSFTCCNPLSRNPRRANRDTDAGGNCNA
jgi:hypothetical protein